MSKWLDGLYKYSVWIIAIVSILGYIGYRSITFNGDIENVLTSWDTWANLAFVIYLNLIIQTAAIDSGVSTGMDHVHFQLANENNNKLIVKVNNEMKQFRDFVKMLNKSERLIVEEDFLFAHGDVGFNELSKKNKKKFKKLKPKSHNIYGFNLPLYYETTKNGKIDYEASFNKNKGMFSMRIKKVLMGMLFGGITVNIALNVNGLAETLVSVVIISVGLTITFVMSYTPQIFKLTKLLPKKVIQKEILFESYEQYKQGTKVLVKPKQEDAI